MTKRKDLKMRDPLVQAKLEAVAMEAKLLALENEQGKLWPGDLHRRLSQIRKNIEDAQQLARDDR